MIIYRMRPFKIKVSETVMVRLHNEIRRLDESRYEHSLHVTDLCPSMNYCQGSDPL
jgi:hypothetical protein